jgi:hypothetical protein
VGHSSRTERVPKPLRGIARLGTIGSRLSAGRLAWTCQVGRRRAPTGQTGQLVRFGSGEKSVPTNWRDLGMAKRFGQGEKPGPTNWRDLGMAKRFGHGEKPGPTNWRDLGMAKTLGVLKMARPAALPRPQTHHQLVRFRYGGNRPLGAGTAQGPRRELADSADAR